jgi:hypothetical protein
VSVEERPSLVDGGAAVDPLVSIGGFAHRSRLSMKALRPGRGSSSITERWTKTATAPSRCAPINPAHEGLAAVSMRREPAHREAYVRLRKAQFEHPQILSAYDAVEQWISSQGLTDAGPRARSTSPTSTQPGRQTRCATWRTRCGELSVRHSGYGRHKCGVRAGCAGMCGAGRPGRVGRWGARTAR